MLQYLNVNIWHILFQIDVICESSAKKIPHPRRGLSALPLNIFIPIKLL